MFGKLEVGDKKPTKEEEEKYIQELFDISMAAPEVLIGWKPVGIEDYEFCIDFLKTMKKNTRKVVDEMLSK